jgi:hypothetical protein
LGDIFFKSRNSLIFSFGADEMILDNVLFDERDRKRFDTSTSLYSRVAYQRQYQRTSFGLDYALGGRFYNRSDSFNQVTHDGGLSIQHRITPRLTLSLGDRVSVSPDGGRLFRQDLVTTPLPADFLPNSTLILRLNKTILNTTYGGLSYQLSQRSGIAFGANGSLSRFQQNNLLEQNRYGGDVSYSYQLSERTSFSLGYGFTYFDILGSLGSRTFTGLVTPSNVVRNHNAYVGVSHQLTRLISGFVNVGPNYTIGDSIDLQTGFRIRPGVRASVNGGIVLSQSLSLDPRTFFSITLNQSISDGLGLGAAVQAQTAGLSLGRRITRRASAAINGGFTRNQFLSNFDDIGREITTNSISVGASWRFNLTEGLSFQASYNRFRQLSTGFFEVIPGRLSGNAGSVGLSYSIPVFY